MYICTYIHICIMYINIYVHDCQFMEPKRTKVTQPKVRVNVT